MHGSFVFPNSVENVIRQSLDHYALDDAVFLAELYYSQVKTDAALFLLSTCHYRLGRTTAAYTLLKLHGARSAQTRFLHAKCCFELDKLQEAEELLVGNDGSIRSFAESTPFARSLLAQIYRKTARDRLATTELMLCIRQNPFLWSSLEKLAQSGLENDLEIISILYNRLIRSSDELGTTSICDSQLDLCPNESSDIMKQEFASTPSPLRTHHLVVADHGKNPPLAPRKAKIVSKRSTNTSNRSQATLMKVPSQIQTRSRTGGNVLLFVNPNSENEATTKQRQSILRASNKKQLQCLTRLNVSSNPVVNADEQTDNTSRDDNKPTTEQTAPSKEQWLKMTRSPACDHLLDTIGRLSQILLSCTRFDSVSALNLILSLPPPLRRIPATLVLQARAHFEAGDYRKSVAVFQVYRRTYEHCLDGVDLYSTALWHLQKENELSALTQQLTTEYRSAPQTWCVAGNCFSLQKEHDTAIKLFERAIQLAPWFTYAYTLLGHELVSIEQYSRATQAFRAALSLQPNSYNAWYGLGSIHYKQEQMSLARVCFSRAVLVNPRNSLLICQLSIVEQALKRPDAALALLDEALVEQPHNAVCRYHRASLLYAKERYEEALDELAGLKLIAPKEAQVFFLAGRVHKKLKQTHLALMNFSWASEMDPRGEQNHPSIGDRRYDEEPVTALAAIDPDQVGDMQSMDSDSSV